MVDNKTTVTLLTLFKHDSLSLYELSLKTKFSKKELLTQLETISQILEDQGFSPLIVDGELYSLSKAVREEADRVFALFNHQQIYLSQAERLNLIYLYTFCRRDFVSNIHYQDLLKVSKNTTLADIKALRDSLNEFGLQLIYTRSQGYTLSGSERDKHRLALYAITELLKSPIGFWALDYLMTEWQYFNAFTHLENLINTYAKLGGLTPIQDRLRTCLYLLIIIALRYQRTGQVLDEFTTSQRSGALRELTLLIARELRKLYPSTIIGQATEHYFQLILSGCFEGDDEKDSFFRTLTLAIIDEMEVVSLLNFDKREELVTGLQKHIIPAYYRLKYGLCCDNSYTETIKRDYADLFILVKKALRPLQEELGFDIPDGEVSYFVIHFGGYLQRHSQPLSPYRAVIVCPNGVSSSLIIKEHLRTLFTKISFAEVTRLERLRELNPDSYDLIFSTVSLSSHKPVYLVSLSMNEEQERQLWQLVIRDFPALEEENLQIEQLLHVIKNYATIHQEKELRQALTLFFAQQEKLEKDVRPLLHELITEETYRVSREPLSWQDAIKLSGQPLLEHGKIEESYLQAMVDKVETFGPFIDLGKGIAIPHARPEDGVNEVGMAVLSLETPIYLLDDPQHPIYLLICIAAVDNASHLKALSHLTKLLRNPSNIDTLVKAKTYQEIEKLIKQEAV